MKNSITSSNVASVLLEVPMIVGFLVPRIVCRNHLEDLPRLRVLFLITRVPS